MTVSHVAPAVGNCPSEVISSNRTCCPRGSVVDKDGACCESGRLDACGVCDGTAKVVDMLGRCCSHELAADGLCCREGVDECGVCGGLGTTCGMNMHMHLSSNSSLGFEQLVKHTVPGKLATALASASIMSPADLGIEVGKGSRPVSGGFEGLVTYTTPPLPGRVPASVAADVAGIGQLEKVAYAGVCGNSICEVGEQTRPDGLGSCEADCAFPQMLECQCGGHGVCQPTTGVCECFVGYEGDWCQDCATNFTDVAGSCFPTVQSHHRSVAPSLEASYADGERGSAFESEETGHLMDLLTVLLAMLSVALATALGALIAIHVFVRAASARESDDVDSMGCR